MKKEPYHINNWIFLILLILIQFNSCKKDEQIVNRFEYNEPEYPEKPNGRYLKSIYYVFPSNVPINSGIKVKFFYNSKHYVDYFKIYGDETREYGFVVKVEYNVGGLVNRIKYFDIDSIIYSYEDFEYDGSRRLNKISKYEKIKNKDIYELASYNEFRYPSSDTIVELSYIKYYDFKQPHKEVYIYDELRNINEKLYFEPNASHPSSSTEYYYNNKKKPFENLGLPTYEITYDEFQMTEIFSKNQVTGYQNYSYGYDNIKVAFGDPEYNYFEYDSLDFPISKDGSIFYNYIDLN